MIDQRKNLCYIVTVTYQIKNGVGVIKNVSKEFISLHSINTEKCLKFAERVANRDKQFYKLDKSDWWISQRTVPLSDYCK